MIGEISCAINRVEEQIEQLFDEKEEFIMANEDVLPRTMYLKKLAEIDSRIDELKKTLVSSVSYTHLTLPTNSLV